MCRIEKPKGWSSRTKFNSVVVLEHFRRSNATAIQESAVEAPKIDQYVTSIPSLNFCMTT